MSTGKGISAMLETAQRAHSSDHPDALKQIFRVRKRSKPKKILIRASSRRRAIQELQKLKRMVR